MLFEIITTVFDAGLLFMFFMLIFDFDAEKQKKHIGCCILFCLILIMNLFCIWGLR